MTRGRSHPVALRRSTARRRYSRACLLDLFLLGSMFAAVAAPVSAMAQSGSQRDGRWAILLAGISGDKDLQREFIGEVKDLYAILSGPMQLAGDHMRVLVDDPTLLPGVAAEKSTTENLLGSCREIAGRSAEDDRVFVFIAGHGNFDGKTYKLNLVGPDPTADELAAAIYSIPARSFVVVNTTNCSGGSAAALSRPGRIVVTATRTGQEKNRTYTGRFFVEALKDSSADVDRNGRISVQEAFNYALQKVEEYYSSEGLIQTEHPVLTDGSDGLLARTAYLDSGMRPSDESTLSAEELRLKKESDSLEKEIEALKQGRTGMSEEEYERKLEALLLRLAEINAQQRRQPPQAPDQ